MTVPIALGSSHNETFGASARKKKPQIDANKRRSGSAFIRVYLRLYFNNLNRAAFGAEHAHAWSNADGWHLNIDRRN